MPFLWISIAILLIGIFIFGFSYICFYITFFVPKSNRKKPPKPIRGKAYEPHLQTLRALEEEAKRTPCEEVFIKSFDGLTLCAHYYECDKNAPMEIMFHGYRSSAERDLSGGIQRCFLIHRNVLIVDQRTAGKSEGTVITFGIRERKDCLSWIEYAVQRFGTQKKIILSGISMGAATVLMASSLNLPKNVVGIVADCAYTSPKDIIQKCIRDMKLPVFLVYPFIKLGAKLYGKFDLEEASPFEACKTCKIPIAFFHTTGDEFIPVQMTIDNYEACQCRKSLSLIEGNGHGLAYVLEPKRYLDDLQRFQTEDLQ